MNLLKKLYCSECVDSKLISCCYSIDKPTMRDSSYKYLIGQSGVGCVPKAFRTDSGFKNFLKVYNLSIVKSTVEILGRRGERFVCCSLKGKYKVFLFWHKSELPKNAKPFIGLSNGSYVDCYYADIDGWRVVCIPNPNADEVYHPYSNYFEISKKWG